MKSIEEMIFETRFKGEEFDANDYNDWAKENEWEAYTICLSIAKQLLQHGVMQGLPYNCLSKNKACELPMNSCRHCTVSGSPTVGKAGGNASVSDGK
jgi:hypothetical protein